jgi:hypothetical protein
MAKFYKTEVIPKNNRAINIQNIAFIATAPNNSTRIVLNVSANGDLIEYLIGKPYDTVIREIELLSKD